ncbi:hypothetical protein [Rhodococcus phenolicus]|uniref:hypothetical protein n=1 Tax=Rhodococcus phenolicus TaxID=263849 RepID=UPI000AAF6D15|nr:hypothetical protein [Rhodococcus phenolicus]
MNEPNEHDWRPQESAPSTPPTEPTGTGGHGRHRWMMLACCVPMLIIAGALVLTGSASVGGLVFALACAAMMAMMMFSPGGHRH